MPAHYYIFITHCGQHGISVHIFLYFERIYFNLIIHLINISGIDLVVFGVVNNVPFNILININVFDQESISPHNHKGLPGSTWE